MNLVAFCQNQYQMFIKTVFNFPSLLFNSGFQNRISLIVIACLVHNFLLYSSKSNANTLMELPKCPIAKTNSHWTPFN